jgi:hypothetical protein
VLEYISGSKLRIDFCAYTLYYIFERGQLAQALHERVHAGVPVRILIGDPANPHLFANIQVQTKAPMGGQMKFVSDSIATWKSDPAVSNLDARKLSEGPLPISVLRFDDRMLVVHYLWTRFTSETPCLLIQGLDKPLFQTYADEFDHLFDVGTAI